MKKKIFAAALSLIMVLSLFPVSAFAANNNSAQLNKDYIAEALTVLSAMNSNRTFEIESASYLKGFSDENEYVLLTFEGKGYAIINLQTERIVEALPDGTNPYSECDKIAYYGGPLNYLYKENNGNFYSVESGEIVSNTTIEKLSQNVNNAVNRSESERTASANTSRASYPASALVRYSDYIIKEMPFGYNVDGTCGSVAAAMMLTYFDYKIKTPGTVIPASIGYGEPLHQELIPYCEGWLGSTSASVSSGINEWLENNEDEHNVDKIVTAHYFYVLWGSYAKTSIAAHKPCVLALGDILGSPYGNHQVLAFGYYSNANGDYYNIHLGWHGEGDSNAILDSSWAIGVCYLD